jgi:hypothetical protein
MDNPSNLFNLDSDSKPKADKSEEDDDQTQFHEDNGPS